ncbi:MAG TPA: SDR family NAD(P)-dependent oxidoreductase [Bryobacteraceae bacterium]|nr:SDR family NAD(P)-dependent oxidoreductase [Bryobacteraceae bacterium]
MDSAYRAVAMVGAGAILPDAPNVAAFWQNVQSGRYSISEVSPDRWDPALYYDPDHNAPDKTYTKIGGWVRQFEWNPAQWHMAVPPRVVDAMDEAQQWAIACTRQALEDYGYPQRPLNADRTAVILGNAMAGEKHYLTSLRVYFPEYARELAETASFAVLPEAVRRDIRRELHHRIERLIPEITEDTMPGELANCIAGRIANLFNFHGPNFVTDAACASAMAAIGSAVEGLAENQFDAAITGGIDRNMGASTFVKFCKIGALSATGTRPYAEGADGFVMGEGAVIFVLKRLADAVRDGDRIYAVVRGIGGSSDGKGKGITAPNPVGQRLCVERAWENAGLSPATATLIEGHGTSTRVGDVVEVESFSEVLRSLNVPAGSVALGSVKSNIGHLKGAAGAAGLLKAALALRDKVLPPSVNCQRPSPDIDFAHSPLYVNGEMKPWSAVRDGARRVGVSAFGFGGTNFHAVLEEYIPHRLSGNGKRSAARATQPAAPANPASATAKAPLRGVFVIGAPTAAGLAERLRSIKEAPAPAAPAEADLRAPERLAIDFADAAEWKDKSARALKALAADQPAVWKALRAQGIFRGRGPAPKVAFLYTGQGSQYVNMLQPLRAAEPIVAETFAEADRVMAPILGQPLSQFIFVNQADPKAVARAEEELRQTAITQPAVLATDLALTRLLAAYGIQPDMAMGHSLGEYGALVAAGALPFADALEAVAARGREMTRVSVADNGRMAAVFAPLAEIERILKSVDGYVVIANINSGRQAVVGGASRAVEQAIEAFQKAGYEVVPLPVSHAFHTSIVAPASGPLRLLLERLHFAPPRVPVVANVNGEFYPAGTDAVPRMLDILARQMASPVQFVKGLRSLYDAGARVFVEVGPKKALQGFAEEVLGDAGDVLSLFTNHPKFGDVASFNQALCGLYAAGLGNGTAARSELQSGFPEPVVVTGAALGLPGPGHIFDDSNVARILRGEQFIDVIPSRLRRAMLDKHITRLVKSEEGGPTFETIGSIGEVIKLAGRGGDFDLEKEFGVSAERLAALDRVTQLAMAVGLDALRDAGIPLVMRYKTTSKRTQLPDRWGLPDAMRDDTGVIFASVFPGFDSFAGQMSRYYKDCARREQLSMLESMSARLADGGASGVAQEVALRIDELRDSLEREPYAFDRRFLFHVLAMGHSQFAEFIGARGPNTQINSACASTTQAVATAEDWIRAGRCRRVIVVSADDITTDHLTEWFGAGFLATGAAATDDIVEDVATPFDRRRHGMIMGMGAAALIVESAEAARERGIRPICEVLRTVTANSAFHGTRLDVEHICRVMEDLVAGAERNHGIQRHEIAPRTVFVSHETYTPARGGSAAAEITALRRVFGDQADRIVIANTKGFTGHAMGAGIEDVVAVKALETGCVPPVPNFKEPDPELGRLNLSRGGGYPVEYALRLGAGFGSQISMTLYRWVKGDGVARPRPQSLGYAMRIADQAAWSAWLTRMAGHADADLEVVQRTLRVRSHAVPQSEPARAVAAPAPAPTPPAPVIAKPAADPVKDRILAVVAEKTGYPADMLDLDLDLEADLGVDTVKQADLFATVREAYGIPRDDKLKLRDFPTLAHVIRFVHERANGQIPLPAAAPAAAAREAADDDPVKQRILAVVAEKTGYPADMLDLDLDLEADLGVDTVKQADLFATVREAYGIPRDDKLKLRDFPTLAHVIRFVHERANGQIPLPAAAPAAATREPADDDPVKQRILALVVEKTGYPADMLDLDLDLEADLGVDTVKQADLFATVRQLFNIPRDENRKLRDFPTLAHVIKFVHEQRRDILMAEPPAPSLQPPVQGAAEEIQIPRRVPVPTLRPPLELCKPTGVTLARGRRIAIMPDKGGVGEALARKLSAYGVDVFMLDGAPVAPPVHGVYWLPALDDEGNLWNMDLAAWREALRVRVKSLYSTMRGLYQQIAAPDTFLVAATRMGGQHGYGAAPAAAPMGGAVSGFAKTYKRERPEALVKAVDFETGRSDEEVAAALLAETLRDPGAVEIGCQGGLRWTVSLEERRAEDSGPGLPLRKDTVFLITGAAGSIVSAITADLAAASGGTFYLLDLTPEPDPHHPDLPRLAADKEGLMRDLHARIKARGERATPAMVEKELASLERLAAARDAIAAVRTAGGTAHYFSVDLTNPEAVTGVMDKVRQQSGRIDVLLHAAGMERSRFLPDKEPREFDLVFDVKADGWFNLMHAIGGMPLGATVAFSSVAGRFGNAGQADYSSANDLLCKIASSYRVTRPETRAIAIDWTAWGGIGMATRGSVPEMMARAGIEMLPSAAAVPWIRRELTAGGARGEIVVARALGILRNEWDATGGLDPAAAIPAGPMVGRIAGIDADGWVHIETTLDPAVQPFLRDHQIEGKPVLPGVMGIEAFAETALCMLPGWHVEAVEEVDFLAPFKFYRGEPRALAIEAVFRPRGGGVVAECRLSGSRALPNQAEPQVTTHFTARVRLTRELPRAATAPPLGKPAGAPVEAAEIYRVFFHGPAYQVLERAWLEENRTVGQFYTRLPGHHHPADRPLAMSPRLIELCFQAAALREVTGQGRIGLPRHVGEVRVWPAPDPDGRKLYAIVLPDPGNESCAVQVVDAEGHRYVDLSAYQMVAHPDAVDVTPLTCLASVA